MSAKISSGEIKDDLSVERPHVVDPSFILDLREFVGAIDQEQDALFVIKPLQSQDIIGERSQLKTAAAEA